MLVSGTSPSKFRVSSSFSLLSYENWGSTRAIIRDGGPGSKVAFLQSGNNRESVRNRTTVEKSSGFHSVSTLNERWLREEVEELVELESEESDFEPLWSPVVESMAVFCFHS